MAPTIKQPSTAPAPSAASGLTFGELEQLIHQYVGKNVDYQQQFLNQVHAVNRMCATVGRDSRQCQKLHRLLHLLQHYYAMLEINANVADEYLASLEAYVVGLEARADGDGQDLALIDMPREHIYPFFSLAHRELMHIREMLAELEVFQQDDDVEEKPKVDGQLVAMMSKQVDDLNAVCSKEERLEAALKAMNKDEDTKDSVIVSSCKQLTLPMEK